MNKCRTFFNTNGKSYYILFGKKGEKAFLCNMYDEQYVICMVLEDYSWWHGEYFENFDEAYEYWKGLENNEI